MRYLLRYIRLHATFRQLVKFMSLELEKGVQDMDMYELLSRVTLEVMGEAGLGYSFGLFKQNERDPFAEDMKAFV